MKRLSLSLATVALLSVSLTTQAGFLDDALKIAQALQSGDTGAALNQAANMATAQKQQAAPATAYVDTTPYSVAQLGAMDCAALAVSSATAQREIKGLQAQAEQFDNLQTQAQQEAASSGNAKALGGLLSIAGNIMAQKGSSSASTLTTLGNNLSTTQSEAQLQTMNSDALLKAYKKHEADLENIKIYQKSKSCKI